MSVPIEPIGSTPELMIGFRKKFISSSNYFSGFSVDIDLDYCNNLNDIIIEFKKMLSFILKQFNFELLIDKLNNTNMHIFDL